MKVRTVVGTVVVVENIKCSEYVLFDNPHPNPQIPQQPRAEDLFYQIKRSVDLVL